MAKVQVGFLQLSLILEFAEQKFVNLFQIERIEKIEQEIGW